MIMYTLPDLSNAVPPTFVPPPYPLTEAGVTVTLLEVSFVFLLIVAFVATLIGVRAVIFLLTKGKV